MARYDRTETASVILVEWIEHLDAEAAGIIDGIRPRRMDCDEALYGLRAVRIGDAEGRCTRPNNHSALGSIPERDGIRVCKRTDDSMFWRAEA